MKKFYRDKDRIAHVKLWLTVDQIAVLMNSAIYHSRPLDLAKEAQFVLDCACSRDGGFIEAGEDLQSDGWRPLVVDASRLPHPDDLRRRRQSKHARIKARAAAWVEHLKKQGVR